MWALLHSVSWVCAYSLLARGAPFHSPATSALVFSLLKGLLAHVQLQGLVACRHPENVDSRVTWWTVCACVAVAERGQRPLERRSPEQ